VGDITASRKVRVPDIPMDQIAEYYLQKKPFPWHWGNSLYLEWFSERNGRVVIESAVFQLTVSGESTWEMSEEQEKRQREENQRAITGFMDRLVKAADAEREDAAAPEEATDDDEDTPLTEEEAEALQERSDRLVDRITAGMEREGAAADYEQILEEELERLRREQGEEETEAEAAPGEEELLDDIRDAVDELLDDPDFLEELERDHPLVARVQDYSLQLRRLSEEFGWLPEDAQHEHPAGVLTTSVMSAGAKLAGALNGEKWPPELDACALILVRLKRARGYLEDALIAAESCREERVIEPAQLEPIVDEVTDVAWEVDRLIDELRERLAGGGA
jgi:hypothetical protein